MSVPASMMGSAYKVWSRCPSACLRIILLYSASAMLSPPRCARCLSSAREFLAASNSDKE
eukprot:1214706-Pleurochrysis_carterae.AAC.1